jgi:hypothetical protein
MQPYARHADASLQSVEGLRQQLRMDPRAAHIASRLSCWRGPELQGFGVVLFVGIVALVVAFPISISI